MGFSMPRLYVHSGSSVSVSILPTSLGLGGSRPFSLHPSTTQPLRIGPSDTRITAAISVFRDESGLALPVRLFRQASEGAARHTGLRH